MVKIEFYPMDIDYVSEENIPKIRLFGKTVDEKRICAIDSKFRPYFWVFVEKDIENVAKDIKKIKDNEFFVEDAEIVDKKYLDKDVKAIKVIFNDPKGFQNIKEKIKEIKNIEIKEMDINFTRRYLIDKKIIPLTLYEVEGELIKNDFDVDYCIEIDKIKQVNDDVIANPKILAFDIEVYNPRGKFLKGEEEIIMIGFYGSNDYKKVITWKKFKTDKKYIEFVNSELELIEKFKDVIEKFKPDYLVGYYTDGFDLPYLKQRASVYNIALDLGLDNSTIKFSKRRDVMISKITGLVHLDIFKFIRHIVAGSLQTNIYDLNSVAQELLNEGKKEIEINGLAKAWDKGDIESFCEYNLHDAIITYKLFINLLPNLEELVKLIGQPIVDICRMTYGQLVEWYLIKRAREFNEITPNRPKYNEIGIRRLRTYKGAFVFEPKPGLYDNVVMLDYKSLYPSIIVAKNIYLGTLTKDKKNSYESPLLEVDGEEKKYYFSYKKEGFIPLVIKDLIMRRNRIRELLKKEKSPLLKARSYALKTVANASYGYLGFPGARWYSLESAASITAFAREYIQKTIKLAQDKKFEVIYSDTDSITIVLRNKKKEDILNFLKGVNKELPSLMELELENFYPRGIFVSKKSGEKGAKKKYALIDEQDNIKVIGFEAIRSDWSLLARKVQRKVLEIILKEGNKEKAFNYVRSIIDDIKNKKIPLNEMIIQTQLRKNVNEYDQRGPHVAVAEKMLQKDMVVGAGSIIKFIISEGKEKIRDRAKLPEDCKDYDANYYINNQVIPAVSQLFEVLGYKKEELLESKEQSKLGDF
jgi:DNA polymerase elongation subunit (family B)